MTNHEQDQSGGQSEGQVSDAESLDPAGADTPIADGDATSAYPGDESGEAQEPNESGPNANPHRDQDTH
ncbi:hypothetical protein [Nocardioides currus]|uniref:Uncharacterized protein n=1 Tax=Nocardioides currus TaxID=2133958 RepID=A0A2R7YVB8_9ACTN|nr:hypothetical protein [Nocardioides currus]PUA80016.1 hypothetical protein C7S10_15785 [Nocardioides currus]